MEVVISIVAKIAEQLTNVVQILQELRQDIRDHHKLDDDCGLQVEIPEFEGTLDPNDFMDWLCRIEKVFEFKEYDDQKKCKVAIIHLKEYASLWWENVKKQRDRDGKEKVCSWEKLKKLLKRRFLPNDYKQDLYLKIHALRQDGRSVEEYIREFETLMMRCEVLEPNEITNARFLKGLKPEIANIVELHSYCSLDDICKLAIKVERQKKTQKSTMMKPFSREGSRSYFSEKLFFKDPSSYGKLEKIGEVSKVKPSFIKLDPMESKCFKCQGYGHIQGNCPNIRVMTMKDIEEIDEAYLEEHGDEKPVAELEEEEVFEQAYAGNMLILHKALQAHHSPSNEQRENIFQTRCTINGRVCSVIINSGSWANVASTTLVEKLNLSTINHPHPYKLQWLSQGSQLQVSKQVLINFSIGKHYVDQVTSDVINMDACHLLLGRPWQYDSGAKHDGRRNTYSVKVGEKLITLAPLGVSQIHQAHREEGKKKSLFIRENQVKEAI